MANLNLTHSGNINIINAYLSGNQIQVEYGPNNTGAVTGFSFNPPLGSSFVCGETYTITATPNYSGVVLTETFTVSGTDIGGTPRSDTSTLRQDYDRDLTHYDITITGTGLNITSSSVTSDYVEIVVEIDDEDYAEIGITPGGGSTVVYPIDDIETPPDTGDTGSTARVITIVVADSITGTGIASATYSPSNATVSLRYTSNSPAYATIDASTGQITVLQNGDVRFFVYDDLTGYFDSKEVHCYIEGWEPDTGDTGVVISSLTINVADTITDSGQATATYSPVNGDVDLHYSSNLPSVASIDETTGAITVYSTGNVTFCVRDSNTNLSNCKTVYVVKSNPIVYASAITLNVANTITDSGQATTTVEPAGATTSLVYSSSDSSIAVINSSTGDITVLQDGTVEICVTDQLTNLSDCKTITVVKTEPDTGSTTGSSEYLMFRITGDGYINWLNEGDGPTTKTIEYNKNNSGWVSITSTTGGTRINVTAGDVVKFRGDNSTYSVQTANAGFPRNYFRNSTCSFTLEGNIMSLVSSTNFSNITVLEEATAAYTGLNNYNVFNGMFWGCTGLTDASGLVLPATTLSIQCYAFMFTGCSSLVNPPSLPATTLSAACYLGMFNGCSSLRTAPSLPAINMAAGCYRNMFNGCISLTNMPLLSSTSLANYCYDSMFSGCTNLVNVQASLPATTLTTGCYQYMFANCSSLTTAPSLPATTLVDSNPSDTTNGVYLCMFMNCTSLVTPPALPATTLGTNCYYSMFQGCISLTYAPDLPATTLKNYSYYRMFTSCSSLSSIRCLAVDISASYSHRYWLSGVASTGTFTKAASMTSWPSGTSGIPTGWTVVDA